jgi:hypothetical protein
MVSGRLSSSYSTNGTRRVTPVTNLSNIILGGILKIPFDSLLWLIVYTKISQFTLGVWCLTPLSDISWWGKSEKTTDLPQVIDKLYHILLY